MGQPAQLLPPLHFDSATLDSGTRSVPYDPCSTSGYGSRGAWSSPWAPTPTVETSSRCVEVVHGVFDVVVEILVLHERVGSGIAETWSSHLAVVPCQVGDAVGGWSADGGVVSVMVVAVEPAVKGSSSGGF